MRNSRSVLIVLDDDSGEGGGDDKSVAFAVVKDATDSDQRSIPTAIARRT